MRIIEYPIHLIKSIRTATHTHATLTTDTHANNYVYTRAVVEEYAREAIFSFSIKDDNGRTQRDVASLLKLITLLNLDLVDETFMQLGLSDYQLPPRGLWNHRTPIDIWHNEALTHIWDIIDDHRLSIDDLYISKRELPPHKGNFSEFI